MGMTTAVFAGMGAVVLYGLGAVFLAAWGSQKRQKKRARTAALICERRDGKATTTRSRTLLWPSNV
jgi:hypothetical protein